MDKDEFRKTLMIAANIANRAARLEARMHNFDFFKYLEQLGPEILTNVNKESFKEPAFRAFMWTNFVQAMAIMDINEPYVPKDNVINFEQARIRRLA